MWTSSGLRVAPARLHAAGLEVAAVGARGNLAVFVLARYPDFQVVGLHGAEAHVAGAQRQNAVRQLQGLQHALGVGGQAFQGFHGFRWLDHLDHLDLVELVLADHATGVAARGTGFAAEARGVGDELDRQVLGVDDLVGNDVGQRHFGGRDQVEVGFAFAGNLEQVFLELRQLAGALQRRGLDQVRGVGLFVAMLVDMQVDHELRQGAVQAGDRAAQQGKARAGELGRGLEVQPAVALAEGDVVLDLEVELARGAPAAHFDVAVFVFTDRYAGVRQVGDGQEDLVQLGLDLVQLDLAGRQLTGHALDVSHQRGDVLALGLGLADGLGACVALGLQLFGTGLHRLAALFQGFDARDIQAEATGGQAVRHFLKLAA